MASQTLTRFLPDETDANSPPRADADAKTAENTYHDPLKPGRFTSNNPGRPKGSANRATINVKTALHEAFIGLGGVPALIRWGKRNRSEFYRVWVRIAPIDVNVSATTDFARELAEARRRVGPPIAPAADPIDVTAEAVPAKPALPAPDALEGEQ
jgi:hypothetical protein